jgi:hypothetical protein
MRRTTRKGKFMYRRLILIGVAIASLAACRPADTPVATSVASSTPSSVTTHVPASPTAGTSGSGDTSTYVSRFRQEFPDLADGKTDSQIIDDGEADCSDMAGSWKIVTPSMGQRYGLGSSTADQAVLYNVALLDMFALCPAR